MGGLPLRFSSIEGKPRPKDHATLLLQAGANCNAVNSQGCTPLLVSRLLPHGFACRAHCACVLRWVQPATCSGLHHHLSRACCSAQLAAVNGHSKVVDLLLRHGADKSIPNKEGKTPAEVAKTPEIKSAIECFTG